MSKPQSLATEDLRLQFCRKPYWVIRLKRSIYITCLFSNLVGKQKSNIRISDVLDIIFKITVLAWCGINTINFTFYNLDPPPHNIHTKAYT